jgi:hypothetical protein
MTKEERERFEELADKARRKFIEYSDFDPTEWLDSPDEVEDYNKLFDIYIREV